MTAAQGTSFHIPRGWWESNNGVNFVLPYPSKARFQRALVRSNNINIHEGCVYPFHASRDTCKIPDTFELDSSLSFNHAKYRIIAAPSLL